MDSRTPASLAQFRFACGRGNTPQPGAPSPERLQMGEGFLAGKLIPGQPFIRSGHVVGLQSKLLRYKVPRHGDAHRLVEREVTVERLRPKPQSVESTSVSAGMCFRQRHAPAQILACAPVERQIRFQRDAAPFGPAPGWPFRTRGADRRRSKHREDATGERSDAGVCLADHQRPLARFDRLVNVSPIYVSSTGGFRGGEESVNDLLTLHQRRS